MTTKAGFQLILPYFSMIYLHHATWPLFPKYAAPEAYGFASNRVRNFYIETPDGVHLGAWHILPQAISDQYHLTEEIPQLAFDAALLDELYPVMVYFHGNAGTRLTGHRRHLARHVTSPAVNMNYVAVDYRGFGDSSKVPPKLPSTNKGGDANTFLGKKVPAKQIVIAGHSLGTGVATALVAQLAKLGKDLHSHEPTS
ncbi:MAG: hypothetical protein CYPHOPRED_000507 [Cyphobasidiales sp. Tagirdzhanova-0007]|nr:MAG: hypothetical protein CYPHOPRED_000507 [Cyphobasidiales sp. Tagirdzhanova-0007]